jgi:hypothetical protein
MQHLFLPQAAFQRQLVGADPTVLVIRCLGLGYETQCPEYDVAPRTEIVFTHRDGNA